MTTTAIWIFFYRPRKLSVQTRTAWRKLLNISLTKMVIRSRSQPPRVLASSPMLASVNTPSSADLGQSSATLCTRTSVAASLWSPLRRSSWNALVLLVCFRLIYLFYLLVVRYWNWLYASSVLLQRMLAFNFVSKYAFCSNVGEHRNCPTTTLK